MLNDAMRVDVVGFIASRRGLIDSPRIEFRQSLPEIFVGSAKLVQRGVPVLLRRLRHGWKVKLVRRSRWQTVEAATDLGLPKRHVGHQFPDGVPLRIGATGRLFG